MYKKDTVFFITKTGLLSGIDQALKKYVVAALTQVSSVPQYNYINRAEEIDFACTPTILSPKKFFFPTEEELLSYQADGKMTATIATKPQVLFGIHPCDLNAIKLMDEAFAEGNGDPNYLAKRENSIIIGMDCTKVCDPDAFCYRVEAEEAKDGFDLMLYAIAKDFLIKIGTERGADFLKQYLVTTEAPNATWEKYCEEKEQGFKQHKPFKKLHQFPEIFAKNEDHPVWQEEGKRCLSCGSCIMVCPTCYCFDVADEWELNLKKGARVRKWDACMLNDFAVVTGGENFRHSATERLKHRINRKFNYLMKKHGRAVCVGCGRCVRACLAEINPKTIAEKIADEKK